MKADITGIQNRQLAAGSVCFEVRSKPLAGSSGICLIGYGAVFNVETVIAGEFREVMERGAFARSIQTHDQRCTFNHSFDNLLGRRSSGTLRLSEDSRGLRFECDLPETSIARDVAALVARGDLSGASIMFTEEDGEWEYGQAMPLRRVKRARLVELGPVAMPAYVTTSLGLNGWAAQPQPERSGGDAQTELIRARLARKIHALGAPSADVGAAAARAKALSLRARLAAV